MQLQYQLIVNGGTNYKQFPKTYDYRMTKNIGLAVGKNKGTVNFSVAKDYRKNPQSTYLNDLMRDGIQRLALAHLLLFEEPIDIKTVVLRVIAPEGKIDSLDFSNSMRMYSLISRKLNRHISAAIKDREVIANAITTRKSASPAPIVALYAYLYSKTKEYEFEKFMYLWMALIGFSKALYAIAHNREKEILEKVAYKYNLGKELLNLKNRPGAGKKMMLIIHKNTVEVQSRDQLSVNEKLMSEIHNLLQENSLDGKLSAYGYCLLDFSYFLRCNYFHANEPIPLNVFDNDMVLSSVRLANSLIEEFLDEHITDCILTNREEENP